MSSEQKIGAMNISGGKLLYLKALIAFQSGHANSCAHPKQISIYLEACF